MNSVTIIKSPLITEKTIKSGLASPKSAKAGLANRYVFVVDLKATKPQICQAVENQFGVKVEKINTTIRKGKTHRLARSRSKIAISPRKKAVITLKKGQTIPELEVKS